MFSEYLTFSHDYLEAAFRRLGRGAFFIQIGAMDGVTFDPIYPYVKELGWHGILAEPMPDMFEKLRKNYAGCRGLRFARTAIAEYDGTVRMTRIDPIAVEKKILSVGALGISTLIPSRGVIGGKYERLDQATWANIQTYKRHLVAPCCRLQTFLKRYHVQRLDLLVVDAEGADWMIVKQLPLKQYKPRIIYFEFDHLPNYERTECIRHFRKQGYTVRLDSYRQENLLAMRR